MSHERIASPSSAIPESLQRVSVVGNRVSSWFRWATTVLVAVVAYPRLLNVLGPEEFGLWVVMTAPTSMAGLLDMGVSPAVVALVGRHVSLYRRAANESGFGYGMHGDLRIAMHYAQTGMALSIGVGLAVLVVGMPIAKVLVSSLEAASDVGVAAVFLLSASVINLACTVVGGTTLSVLEGFGRYDISSWVWTTLTVVNGAQLVAVSLCHPSLHSLAFVVLITGALTFVLPVGILWQLGVIRALALAGRTSLSRARVVLGKGLSMGAATAVGGSVDPAIKWFVGLAGGTVAVAGYEVAARVVGSAQGALRALFNPLSSELASGQALLGDDGIGSVLRRSTTHAAALGGASMAAVAVLSGDLLRLWLGVQTMEGTAVSIRILCVGAIGSLIGMPAYRALAGMGRGRRLLAIQTGGVVLTTGLAAGIALGGQISPTTPAVLFAVHMGVGGVASVVLAGPLLDGRSPLGLLSTSFGVTALCGVPVVLASALVGEDASSEVRVMVVTLTWVCVIAGAVAAARLRASRMRKTT